jgi:hypothetical protein
LVAGHLGLEVELAHIEALQDLRQACGALV